jgi:hypothetical protein
MTRRPRLGFEGAGGNPELMRPALVNASQAAALVGRKVCDFLFQRGFELYSNP